MLNRLKAQIDIMIANDKHNTTTRRHKPRGRLQRLDDAVVRSASFHRDRDSSNDNPYSFSHFHRLEVFEMCLFQAEHRREGNQRYHHSRPRLAQLLLPSPPVGQSQKNDRARSILTTVLNLENARGAPDFRRSV